MYTYTCSIIWGKCFSTFSHLPSKVVASSRLSSGFRERNFDQSRAFRPCGQKRTLISIGRAVSDLACFTGVVVSSVGSQLNASWLFTLGRRATCAHGAPERARARAGARAGWRGTTLSDEPRRHAGRRRGGTVRVLKYEFQTTVPIETADQPDPHFPQLTDGRSAGGADSLRSRSAN